jgi:hypothetical protein
MAVTITNVKALQTIIASRQLISVDGKFGPQSLSALNRLPALEQTTVLNASKMMNVQIDLSDNDSLTTVSLEEVESNASMVSNLTNVPTSFILKTVMLENYGTKLLDGFVVETAGKYKGLGQFDKKTWDSVMSPTPFSSVSSTFDSLLAIARLYERNKRSFVVQGNNPNLYSNGVAYLYHNQGAASARLYLNSGRLVYPQQSLKAKRLFKRARDEYEIKRA